MSRVCDRYGINPPVEFLDIHIERDNRLYLDPSAIRNQAKLGDPYAVAAQDLLIDFFGEVVRCRLSTSPTDQAHGLELLEALHEPNETRLGMSAVGVAGRGIAAMLGRELWDALGRSRACRTAALTRIEHMRIFVEGVGEDRISDLTTRVIYPVLVQFTHDQIAKHPQLPSATARVSVDEFDSTLLRWVATKFRLPPERPHPLLLVPKHWVRPWMLMKDDPFYNRFATDRLQQERTTLDSAGRTSAPTKAALKAEHPDKKDFNDRQAAKYIQQGDDLVSEYRHFVDEQYEELTDADRARRTD